MTKFRRKIKKVDSHSSALSIKFISYAFVMQLLQIGNDVELQDDILMNEV